MSLDPHGQTGQPLPKPNSNPSSHDQLIADIAARAAFGLKKYGQPLRAENGRDTLRDAYEECLDLAVYLRTLITERELAQARLTALMQPTPAKPSLMTRLGQVLSARFP